MPAPQPTIFQQAAWLKFASFKLQVPPKWQQPQGVAAEHFAKAFKSEEKSTTPWQPPSPTKPPLFHPATLNKYHTDAQKMLVSKFGEFIDKMAEAICNAIGQWMNTATMAGVVVNGPTAVGGKVVGPPLAPLIIAQAANKTPMQLKFTTAIANVISNGWMTYTTTMTLTGLPVFGPLALFPSPAVVAVPNTPFPVAALTPAPPPSLSPPIMKQQMVAALADPQAPYSSELFESLCDAFDKVFKAWQLSTMVTNILCSGPVPSMTSPVPVPGPVVGGVGIMPPGGFK